MRGPKNTEFEGGVYHGKIILPSEYPLKPPDIIFLTPNGRFEVGKKICLTISSHHAETWSASWSVRTVILAIIGFFPTRGDGAIASLDWSKQEREKLAKASLGWKCEKCGSYNLTALPLEDKLNEELEDENNIPTIRLKNKEEQEKDEAEKKRLEELKKQEEQQCHIPPSPPSPPMEPTPSSTSDNSTSIQPDIFNEDQIHKRRRENIIETSPIQLPRYNTPNSGGTSVRVIDLVILVLFLLLIGLLYKKLF